MNNLRFERILVLLDSESYSQKISLSYNKFTSSSLPNVEIFDKTRLKCRCLMLSYNNESEGIYKADCFVEIFRFKSFF